jgi:hypothetical protein
MAATALLKFNQTTPTPIEGDGEALKVVASNAVTISNSNDLGMVAWTLELLWAPPSSTHGPINPGSPTLLDSGDDVSPCAYDFTPDVPGSYRFRLTVEDSGGTSDVDIRVITVPETNGDLIAPYQKDPLPLEYNVKPNELNFNGQPWGWAGDDSDSDHRLGHAQARSLDALKSVAFDYSQTVFFGKHGNDSNDGLSPANAKLTYGAAATAASGLSPAVGNQIAIVCLDGGTYAGGTALPTYCHLFAPNAVFTSGIQVPAVGSSMRVGELQSSSGPGIHVLTAGDDTYVEAKTLRVTGSGANALQINGVTGVHAKIGRVLVEQSGYGIEVLNGGEGVLDIGSIELRNNGTSGIYIANGTLEVRVDSIEEIGSFSGTSGMIITTGTLNMYAGKIAAGTAITVGSNVANVFAGSVSGGAVGSGLSLFTPGTGGFDYSQTIFVGKHGNDTNDGLNPGQAKLTFASAITAASGLTPGVSNQIAIVCVDGGSYGGLFTVPSYVHVVAPSASFNQTITMSDNSSLRAHAVNATSTTCVVLSGDSIVVELDELNPSVASGTGISNVGSDNRARIGVINITGASAYGINAGTSSTRELAVEIGKIVLGANSAVALYCTAGTVTGSVGRIVESGTPTTTIGIQGAGTWDLFVGELTADTAVNTGAGILNLFVGKIAGTQTGDNLHVVDATGAAPFDYEQTIFVGKHGNDSNDGLNPASAKLTFGSAITAASALTPGASNRIAIVCLDGGTYSGAIVIPSYVHVHARGATFTNEVELGNDSSLVANAVESSDARCIDLAGERIVVDVLRVKPTGSSGIGVFNNGASNVARVGRIEVAGSGGFGIIAGNSSSRRLEVLVGEILLQNNTTTGIYCTSGVVSGVVGRIIEDGTYSTTRAIYAGAGSGVFKLFVGEIIADTAADVNTGELDLVAGTVSGTTTGTTLNVLSADHVNDDDRHLTWPLSIPETSAPGTPAANTAYLYLDSADGDLKVKFDDDTVITIADKP